jgi:hypothetical protein
MNNKMQLHGRINKPQTGILERPWPAGHCDAQFPKKPWMDLQMVVAAENQTSFRPRLTISSAALSALRWSVGRSGDEFCFWGVLESMDTGLYLREAVLAKHQGSPGYSIPDMDWYGDLVLERHEREGLEPWQLACWIHTHPPGLAGPSGVDRQTFTRQFGAQRLAIMLIMTRDLHFCGELSVNLPPLPGLPPARLTSPLKLIFEDPLAQASEEEARRLEQEYLERVSPLGAGLGHAQGDPVAWWPEFTGEGESAALLLKDDDEEDYLMEVGAPRLCRRSGRGQPWPAWPITDHELLDYAQALGFQEDSLTIGDPPPQPESRLLDLELIAARFGDPEMSVGEAAALRERIRRLACAQARREEHAR